jgi:hypothetical protein
MRGLGRRPVLDAPVRTEKRAEETEALHETEPEHHAFFIDRSGQTLT